ncbi:hypothetical protein HK102_005299, partial [Quaeritorhiza haematococci]
SLKLTSATTQTTPKATTPSTSEANLAVATTTTAAAASAKVTPDFTPRSYVCNFVRRASSGLDVQGQERSLLQLRRFFFTLGILLGVLITALIATTNTPSSLNLSSLSPSSLLLLLLDRLSDESALSLLSSPFANLADLDLSTYIPSPPSGLNFSSLLSEIVGSPVDIISNMTALIAGLPSSTLLFLSSSLSSPFASSPEFTASEEFMPGAKFAHENGWHAKYPVILIPGVVSTGLEVWNTPPAKSTPSSHKTPSNPSNPSASPSSNASSSSASSSSASSNTHTNCGQKYFRKRMWGTLNQFRAVLLDRECWMQHMRLDPLTGMDPPGVKLRAAQGLDAADYLFPGYWVWARIISNLAAIGYDNNNMHLAAYDWRLSFQNLEKRDLYFTKLKSMIEIAAQSVPFSPDFDETTFDDNDENTHKEHGNDSNSDKTNRKPTNGGGGGGSSITRVVVLTHSMGSLVFHYFLNWVASEEGGRGGKDWAEKYLKGWVNIAGPMLGVPKTISALLSGEMRDTAQLNSFGTYILEKFFSKRERADLFRSWGGMPSMLPKGGEIVWGSESNAGRRKVEREGGGGEGARGGPRDTGVGEIERGQEQKKVDGTNSRQATAISSTSSSGGERSVPLSSEGAPDDCWSVPVSSNDFAAFGVSSVEELAVSLKLIEAKQVLERLGTMNSNGMAGVSMSKTAGEGKWKSGGGGNDGDCCCLDEGVSRKKDHGQQCSSVRDDANETMCSAPAVHAKDETQVANVGRERRTLGTKGQCDAGDVRVVEYVNMTCCCFSRNEVNARLLATASDSDLEKLTTKIRFLDDPVNLKKRTRPGPRTFGTIVEVRLSGSANGGGGGSTGGSTAFDLNSMSAPASRSPTATSPAKTPPAHASVDTGSNRTPSFVRRWWVSVASYALFTVGSWRGEEIPDEYYEQLVEEWTESVCISMSSLYVSLWTYWSTEFASWWRLAVGWWSAATTWVGGVVGQRETAAASTSRNVDVENDAAVTNSPQSSLGSSSGTTTSQSFKTSPISASGSSSHSFTASSPPHTGIANEQSTVNLTAATIISYLYTQVGEPFATNWERWYKYHVAMTKEEIAASKDDPAAWSNPLLAPLPRFEGVEKARMRRRVEREREREREKGGRGRSDDKGETSGDGRGRGGGGNEFKIYCLYGVGRQTERKYFYLADGVGGAGGTTTAGPTPSSSLFGSSTTSSSFSTPLSQFSGGGAANGNYETNGGGENGNGNGNGDGGGGHYIDVSVQDPVAEVENGVQMAEG